MSMGTDKQRLTEHLAEFGQQQPKIPKTLVQPTAEEVSLHNATHLPFRNWCAWCVKNKAVDPAHRRSA